MCPGAAPFECCWLVWGVQECWGRGGGGGPSGHHVRCPSPSNPPTSTWTLNFVCGPHVNPHPHSRLRPCRYHHPTPVSTAWPRHGEDGDHQGPCLCLGQGLLRVQLQPRNGLPVHGQHLQGAGRIWLLGLLRRVQPTGVCSVTRATRGVVARAAVHGVACIADASLALAPVPVCRGPDLAPPAPHPSHCLPSSPHSPSASNPPSHYHPLPLFPSPPQPPLPPPPPPPPSPPFPFLRPQRCSLCAPFNSRPCVTPFAATARQ
jgi:hypothetical protein